MSRIKGELLAEGWILAQNAKAFVEVASTFAGQQLEDGDWRNVDLGLMTSDSTAKDGWFEFPLEGDSDVTIAFATSPGTEVLSVRVWGNGFSDLAIRFETAFMIFGMYRIEV
ncbi:hypothetical protein [Kutzneria chonburiensis]|uniref:Uncharacterized protein n=1 Tax=Kutzneria chonburiensis TaxID=1483604 RepID=A0ABV6N1L2_9PSEU|nr:hypothetical protein [Kutzneria chonburiensis]